MSAPNQNSYSPNGRYGQDAQNGQYGQYGQSQPGQPGQQGQYGQNQYGQYQQAAYGQPGAQHGQQTQHDQQAQYGQQTQHGQQVPPAAAYPNAPQPVPAQPAPSQPVSSQPVPAQPVPEPQWVPAASRYLTVRFVHTLSALALPILAGVALYCAGAFFGGPEALRIVGLAVIAVFGLWGLWWILTTPRRTRALGYALESNHLMARRGIVFRSMSSMPYGRIQYVDVDSGPLERMCGVARLTVRTAGTTTGTMVLFGIPLNAAEELRADLVRRADERMAAL
ncbi:PH domain-containing protein [Rothia sp. (in: high G+C Gram-positive bacteria)]|uniref:PH domain-containing protein n=1 Tax=Rothia sp. (in: high G+C Gram-positive bacteria) TaxID=1885016 RepID=UPI0025E4789F|nr:PH domain-containing protein [Rothia sp. (in: high G+C Gram-positive bacteria)]